MADESIEVIQLIKVILHPKIDPRVSVLAQASIQPVETLLPISSIANIKQEQNSTYQIFVKQGCLPQAYFEVGKITATLFVKNLSVLNQQ